MTRARYWLAGLGVTFLAVAAMLAVAALAFMPSDDNLAKEVELELESVLGVKVSIGALHWRLFPTPAVAVENVVSAQTPPVVIHKLTVYPSLAALWQRRLKINLAELEGAVVPQLSLRGLDNPYLALAAQEEPASFTVADIPLERFVFRNVTWITRRGIPVMYDGESDFEAGWRPGQAQLRVSGAEAAADLSLVRQGLDDRWRVSINLGGGTANGEVQLHTRPNGRLQLDGKLKPQQIEVAAALTAFNRRPVISGKASGDSTLLASGADVVALVQSLHTQTRFAMSPATLLRFNLDKAVRSIGKDHAGQTPLDTVAGQMDTQNEPSGIVVNFSNIKARSGALSASGRATLANRHVEAEFAVDLIDGVVGVPLKVRGPTDHVVVTVPNGAIAGAVVGTAVLPGVGTAIGARLGAALGKLFDPSTVPPRVTSSTAGARKAER